MSGWHTLLQDASYKGVGFDIEVVDESNGKALAEHARPFVQGIDLEDMGMTGRQVQINAVFWGKGYAGRLKKLLDALEQPGGGVLVHPVWGRMHNMIAASWSYRHEADYVDYAGIDITFREAAEAQEIFVFENAFLVELEALIADIDTYREAAIGFVDAVLAVDAGVSALWGSALGIWSAASGTFGAVRRLFDLDKIAFPDRGGYSAAAFKNGSAKLFADISVMVDTGIRREAGLADNAMHHAGWSPRQRFDGAVAVADRAAAIPDNLLTGRFSDGLQNRLNRLTAKQVQPVAQAVRLLSTSSLLSVATALIEAHGEEMTAPDLIEVNRAMRRRMQAEIAALRAVQTAAAESGGLTANAVYTEAYQTAESLRAAAGRLNALVAAAINQKPPLIVRQAPIDGTIHQIAYEFYGDMARAAELVRLNPHIHHPAFIKRGTLVNSYAK